jgi:hypothetical protein
MLDKKMDHYPLQSSTGDGDGLSVHCMNGTASLAKEVLLYAIKENLYVDWETALDRFSYLYSMGKESNTLNYWNRLLRKVTGEKKESIPSSGD